MFNFWKWLNIGTVPTFKMHLIGTVPTYKMHHVGTVPTFKKLNVGTLKKHFKTGFKGVRAIGGRWIKRGEGFP